MYFVFVSILLVGAFFTGMYMAYETGESPTVCERELGLCNVQFDTLAQELDQCQEWLFTCAQG